MFTGKSIKGVSVRIVTRFGIVASVCSLLCILAILVIQSPKILVCIYNPIIYETQHY